jgi:DNA-directed RNA polymerase
LLNLPIIWKAPNGLDFQQFYQNYENYQIKLKLFGLVKEIHHLTYSKEMNKQKQQNAINPNVIHTLDQSHLYNIILAAKPLIKL